MIDSLIPASHFKARAKALAGEYEVVSVQNNRVHKFVESGFEVMSQGKSTARLRRKYTPLRLLVNKLWRLCLKLGFESISPLEGITLKTSDGTTFSFTLVARSQDVTLVFEFRVADSSDSQLFSAHSDPEYIQKKTNELRRQLRSATGQFSKVKSVLVTAGIKISKPGKSALSACNIAFIDDRAIDFYTQLAESTGSAACYQFLTELVAGEDIPALQNIKVPCVQSRIGNTTSYQLALTPEYLLKVGYVAHRVSAGSGYQRIVTKSRLIAMRSFLDSGGFFPTNIVINFRAERRKPVFEPAPSNYAGLGDSRFGMLNLPATYGCAWIIDGQHRLLSYAGHKWASTAILPVTAFDGLDPAKEAELFEEINSKQKKVSPALLNELYAILHMDSKNAKNQVKAMASATVDTLRGDPSGPFSGKIQGANERGTAVKCITLHQFMNGLTLQGFFYNKYNQDKYHSFGPFWTGDPRESVERASFILTRWFEGIRAECSEEWAQGEEGIAATNRGVIGALRVLRDVFSLLRKQNSDFDDLGEEAIADAIEPYSMIVGTAFKEWKSTEFETARKTPGAGAAPMYHYTLIKFIKSNGEPDFESEGYESWLEGRIAVNTQEALAISTQLEQRIRNNIQRILEQQFGEGWWKEGVPTAIRAKAAALREEKGSEDEPWQFIYLINCRDIVQKNWSLFQHLYSFGPKSNKEDGTKWMVEFNQIRSDASHVGAVRLKPAQVAALKEIQAELDVRGLV